MENDTFPNVLHSIGIQYETPYDPYVPYSEELSGRFPRCLIFNDSRYTIDVDTKIEGGHADVYKAWDNKLQRYVAVKVSEDKLSKHSDYQLKEARLVARLEHENIPKVHDVTVVEHTNRKKEKVLSLVVISEWIDGTSLFHHRIYPSDEAIYKNVLLDVAYALDFLHGKGIVHRDVKPQNIMIASKSPLQHSFDENICIGYLLDLGITNLVVPFDSTNPMKVGTHEYMSPAQHQRLEPTKTDDYWGLGIVLYGLMTGRLPIFHYIDYEGKYYNIGIQLTSKSLLDPYKNKTDVLKKFFHNFFKLEGYKQYKNAGDIVNEFFDIISD